MPISIHNSLPFINLHIDIPEDDENGIRVLVDIGTTMNTRSLEFCLWVMYQCLEMMKDYLYYDKGTAYDVVHILAVLDFKDTNQVVDYSKTTAVIRYKTPYIVEGCGPYILSFALEHDVNLRCVLGLPTFLSIGAAFNLLSWERYCTKINRNFPLL